MTEIDDLEAIAESLPGPHCWAWGTADILFCRVCFTSFRYSTEPTPTGVCPPADSDDDDLPFLPAA